MTIPFKKITPLAQQPSKKHRFDACYDIVATSKKDHGNGVIEYGFGFAVDIPPGFKMLLRPRSSIYKTGLILSNSVGVGDSGYTGEYKAFFYHVIQSLQIYEVGDKILQIEIVPAYLNTEFVEVDNINETERGKGGFGSTGK